MNSNNYAAIMAGGTGSRFWPVSRAGYPKQFLDILNTGKTLLQSTYGRFTGFIPNNNIYVITAEEYVPIVREQLPLLPPENIIGEPSRKNTAACIALIAFKLRKINGKANLIVAPSDHLVNNEQQFQKNCLQGLDFTAQNNAFVTLGIKPANANTGYGYIQREAVAVEKGIYPVKRFTEKPDAATAALFIKDNAYLWNSGIFIWKVTDILKAFCFYMPDMHDLFVCGMGGFNTQFEQATVEHIYEHCESVSIDYAIMEKANDIYVIPAEFGWSDLGTWSSAWENFGRDELENAVACDNALLVDSKGCMVHSTDKKLLLVGGMDDLIVINTSDALLICKKENEQLIKQYVEKLRQTGGESYL
jgi:mannose-1-phosphate guanylyltransferase